MKAAELKRLYGVYGAFYDFQVTPDVTVKCRSVLDIIKSDAIPLNINTIPDMQPDVITIMMNPGSSSPDEDYYITEINTVQSITDRINTVLTKPDTTQYQIMKVMQICGYKHARILNLSDIREPKSPRFIEKVARLSDEHQWRQHSIFCEERSQELLYRIGAKKNVPFIIGWGKNPDLLPLIDQALLRIHGKTLYGHHAEEDSRLYSHPSPMMQAHKDAWLDSITAVLPVNSV